MMAADEKALKKREAVQSHQAEILKHRRAIDELCHNEIFVLPAKLAFYMASSQLVYCRECENSRYAFVFMNSKLMCSWCATRQYGEKKKVKEWRIA